MRIRNERGEGKIAGIILLAALAGFVYFVVHVEVLPNWEKTFLFEVDVDEPTF